MVYKQPLRQTEGFVRSLAKLMEVDIHVPYYSTFPRRGTGLNFQMESQAGANAPIHLVVDSTGLKIFGEVEWLESKHITKPKRKCWRKLYFGLDLVSGDIVCSELTKDEVSDPAALPDLLNQIDGDVSRFIAGGAYDGDLTSDQLMDRFGVGVEIIIPPPKTAVLSPDANGTPTLRDQRIAAIATGGRMAWQVISVYNQRNRREIQMGRGKMVIGPKLKARSFPN